MQAMRKASEKKSKNREARTKKMFTSEIEISSANICGCWKRLNLHLSSVDVCIAKKRRERWKDEKEIGIIRESRYRNVLKPNVNDISKILRYNLCEVFFDSLSVSFLKILENVSLA